MADQRPRRRLAIGLALALAFAGAQATGAAAASGPDYYGVNIQPMVKLQVVPPSTWDAFTGAFAGDGMRIARADIPWSWVEPSAPVGGVHTYDWSRIDPIVDLLNRHGVQFSAVISTAPSWAGAGVRGGANVVPEHYPDLAAFSGAVAARYGGSIDDYEIWTEANSTNFWTHSPNVTEYANALKLIYPAIHANDGGARVLASIGWQGFGSYTAQLLTAAGGSFDAIGFHPYAPHAPAIIGLVTSMRNVLNVNGGGSKPIFVTELGQPAVASGGASSAGSGWVSDAARAATQSLAGDALAHSDCNVQDYLLYANVASETNQEGSGEGFMGIYHKADATPNVTGAAIRDAEARWRAAPSIDLNLCNPAPTPQASMLPLVLALTRDGATCVNGTVTYYGNPVEGAQLSVVTPGGTPVNAPTDAFGHARACAPSAASFVAAAGVFKIATSPTVNCDETAPATPCAASTTVVPQVPIEGLTQNGTALQPGTNLVTTPGATTPGSCLHHLRISLLSLTTRTTRASVRLWCGDALLQRMSVRIDVRRRGAKHRSFLRKVYIIAGNARPFTLQLHLHKGDRLIAARAATPGLGVPQLAAGVTR